MKLKIVKSFLSILAALMVFTSACKDSQMDDDPVGELVVEISGTVNPPAEWAHPRVFASYKKFVDHQYDTTIIGKIENGKWRLFVEKDSGDVNVFLFNDENNNGSFDYMTEPRVPHSENPKSVGKSDINVGEIIVRKISGTVQITPKWTSPLMVLWKGNDIYGYSSITLNTYTLYTGAGSDYKVYAFNDNGDNSYDFNSEGKVGTGASIDTTSGNQTLSSLIVRNICGTVEITPKWTSPFMLLQKGSAIYGYSTITSGTYDFYAVADTDYKVYAFNDNGDGVYDYTSECKLGTGTLIDTTSGDQTVGLLTVRSIYGTITYSNELQNNYPGLIQNLKAGYAYYDGSNILTESIASINVDGTYFVAGLPRSQCRLKLIKDLNGNNFHDLNFSDTMSAVVEPYVIIPERGAGGPPGSDLYIDTTSSDQQIDVELGVLAGTVTKGPLYLYPQAYLGQGGWNELLAATAPTEASSYAFSFFAVKQYKINNGALTPQTYNIPIFDDDSVHNGIYTWPIEADEITNYTPFSADNTIISITAP